MELTLRRERVRIVVDGRTRLAERLPADSPSVWSGGQIALGDEVHGGKAWQGEIGHAEVLTPGNFGFLIVWPRSPPVRVVPAALLRGGACGQKKVPGRRGTG